MIDDMENWILKLDKKIACLQEEKYDGSKCEQCQNYQKYKFCKDKEKILESCKTSMPALYKKGIRI